MVEISEDLSIRGDNSLLLKSVLKLFICTTAKGD